MRAPSCGTLSGAVITIQIHLSRLGSEEGRVTMSRWGWTTKEGREERERRVGSEKFMRKGAMCMSQRAWW